MVVGSGVNSVSAYVLVEEAGPIPPGDQVRIMFVTKLANGQLLSHTSPTIRITDPNGTVVVNDLGMTTFVDSGLSLYGFQSTTSSTEGVYLVECSGTVQANLIEGTERAVGRFELSKKDRRSFHGTG